MALCKLSGVRLAGLATSVPKRCIDNFTDVPPSKREERERLARNIGVAKRRLAEPWQCFSDMAFDAAEQLIRDLRWDKSEIDALIVITQSPDYRLPSTAIILQDRLGLGTGTIAYDVNLGCSAYPYGLHLLGSLISTGAVKKGLLLVGDKSASPMEPLFSDAATVTGLEFDPDAADMLFGLNSDGSGYETIILKVGGGREPFLPHHFIPSSDPDEPVLLKYPHELQMNGPAVLNFSIQRVPEAVNDLIDYAGISLDDVDYFLFHQANNMINNTIKKKLKLDDSRVPMSLEDFGNTSGATIPVTMTVRLGDVISGGKNKLLMCGFGVGLSWGSCLIDVENAVVSSLIEV